jgi:hypothetical protein
MSATTTGRTLVETGTPGWYEDPANPGKKTRKKAGDSVVKETKSSYPPARTKALPTGKVTRHPTVEIKCVDCGKTRTVQVQDRHQVKRCLEHQREHRNKRRRERRQNAKASKKG